MLQALSQLRQHRLRLSVSRLAEHGVHIWKSVYQQFKIDCPTSLRSIERSTTMMMALAGESAGELKMAPDGKRSTTDTALLKTLGPTPLPVWKTKTDALAQQLSTAARLLGPKAQSLELTKATFHTEEDADAWWVENRKQAVEKLKDGPVIIG
jgi:hypothetical protein